MNGHLPGNLRDTQYMNASFNIKKKGPIYVSLNTFNKNKFEISSVIINVVELFNYRNKTMVFKKNIREVHVLSRVDNLVAKYPAWGQLIRLGIPL